MTFAQAQLSLQLMAEERYGGPTRAEAYARKAREDAAASALAEATKARMT